MVSVMHTVSAQTLYYINGFYVCEVKVWFINNVEHNLTYSIPACTLYSLIVRGNKCTISRSQSAGKHSS